jgi:hypothetical protein
LQSQGSILAEKRVEEQADVTDPSWRLLITSVLVIAGHSGNGGLGMPDPLESSI